MKIENPLGAWNYMVQNANRFLESEGEWYSPKQKKRYVIHRVSQNQISIRRESGVVVKIKETFVQRRIQQINAKDGIVAKASLKADVAKLSAFVNLMQPILAWSKNVKEIVVINPLSTLTTELLLLPPREYEIIIRLLRSMQPAFRNSLVERYNSTCCISGTKILNAIDAAHIDPYSNTLNSNVENGLLLRTDLHRLFDHDLLAIEPDSLIVQLHPSILSDAEYAKFHNKPLILGTNGASPSHTLLARRWKNKKW